MARWLIPFTRDKSKWCIGEKQGIGSTKLW
jgi:hypothetical protein